MANSNVSYEEDLNQIRSRQVEILDLIDKIRDAERPPKGIDAIQHNALTIINEIDEIRHRASIARTE